MSEGDFFKGLIFGAAIGATAGILLAPKSGEETRKDIQKLAKDVGDKATDIYTDARKSLDKKVSELKKAGKKIDLDTYKDLVKKVVSEIKSDGKATVDVANKIGLQLNEDWNDVKDALMA